MTSAFRETVVTARHGHSSLTPDVFPPPRLGAAPRFTGPVAVPAVALLAARAPARAPTRVAVLRVALVARLGNIARQQRRLQGPRRAHHVHRVRLRLEPAQHGPRPESSR